MALQVLDKLAVLRERTCFPAMREAFEAHTAAVNFFCASSPAYSPVRRFLRACLGCCESMRAGSTQEHGSAATDQCIRCPSHLDPGDDRYRSSRILLYMTGSITTHKRRAGQAVRAGSAAPASLAANSSLWCLPREESGLGPHALAQVADLTVPASFSSASSCADAAVRDEHGGSLPHHQPA